jgi:hypothetical protein
MLVRGQDDKALQGQLKRLDDEFAKILEESPRVSLTLQKLAGDEEFINERYLGEYTRDMVLRRYRHGKYFSIDR